MKEGWEYGILDDAVNKASSNISLNKIKNDDGDYPVFGAKGFAKNVSFYHQEKEYLGIIKDGAGIGRVKKYPAKSSIVATMQYILPKEGYEIDFVRYFLESLDFENYRTGSTIPHIYFKNYKNAKFPLVSTNEQKQIVTLLDSAFAKIDQAKANIEKNIANAKELFQSKLNEIFSQPADRKGGKEEGWEEKSLGELSLLKSGGTPSRSKKEYWNEGNIPWYSSGELNHTFTNAPKRHITQLGLENSNAKLFPKGSLLIGMYDTAALKMSIIDRDATFNQAIVGVEPEEKIDLIFIMHSINYQRQEILSLRRGVRQKNLNQSKIKAIKIFLPELSVQNKIVYELKNLKEKLQIVLDKFDTKLESLEELKKSLLQKAFAGELTQTAVPS